jgi:uncharacterized protein YjbI with pentapeptide repeats
MANDEHLAKWKEGIPAWNQWREQDRSLIPELSEAELAGANLSKANLRRARLINAELEGANLSGADLEDSNLNGANLRSADLRGAELDSAEISSSYLRPVDLTGADFGGSTFGWGSISADLSQAKGLETVQHRGPTIIDVETLVMSKGRIPESFLRGCGVPDEFITFAKSLVTSPIQFYSCFISYSTKDQDFADRLYADLQNKGVRCWFAPHDIQGGRKIHEQIDEAIRLHDKLLLILSPHSMASEWVETEIAKARKREVRDQRRVLFPIRLAPFETLRDWECFDADTGKDSAREIREYFIPDFSNWKNHDSYQEAFQRLISDLKASDSK